MEIKVPAVGESINEVVIGSWMKVDGAHVESEEVVCEIESDKASFEVRAEISGTLRIKAQEGDTVPIGTVIAQIAPGKNMSAQAPPAEPAPASAAVEAGAAPVPVVVPTVGESITEVVLGQWMKADGDRVALDESLAELESEKASFELAAPVAGTLRIHVQAGETVAIGAKVCTIEPSSEAAAVSEAASTPSQASTAATMPTTGPAQGHPSPAAAKILAEKDVASTSVQGTGTGGRITKGDALKASGPSQQPKQVAAAAAPLQKTQRQERRERISNLRKTISRRLVAVKNQTAMLTTFNEVDMQAIMDTRKAYKELFKEKYEIGLGFMSFFTRAVCIALQEWPSVNARIEGEEMIYSDFCDISIAVSTPKGLVVPVVRQAESLDFAGIEKEVMRLALRARDGKLSIDEMTGGTFTITNGGVFGSLLSTPIINAPQSGILGMHNIVQRPVVMDGKIEVRPMMYIALSYDHRTIDGRESVSFLVRIKELLEDPTRLLLSI